jgi:phosphatidylserine synthase
MGDPVLESAVEPTAGSRRPARAFGLKDVLTTCNLLGGVFALYFCIEGGRVRLAAYALLIGYLGDALDGIVARATGGGNRFGAEFDNIVDHLTQCIAPAAIVYCGFRDLGVPVALGLAALLILTGSIRHARSAVKKCELSLCWVGLPRTVSMFIAIGYVNGTLFPMAPGGKWTGAGLMVVLAVLNLVPLPFLSHHGRRLQWPVRLTIAAAFTSVILSALIPVLRPFAFDCLFFWMTGYALSSWIPMRPEERREFFRVTRKWLRDIAAAR